MFTTRPLKTYSRQQKKRRRASVELERNDNDAEDSSDQEDNGCHVKRRRVGCVNGIGKVIRPLSAVSKSSPAMRSSSTTGTGSKSEVSDCARGSARRTFLLSSSSLLSSSLPCLGEGDSTTPPSSPPPLTASSSIPGVYDDDYGDDDDGGCKDRDSGTNENNRFSREAIAVTNTSTSDTIKAMPLAPRSANVPSKLLSSKSKSHARSIKQSSRPRLTQLCIDLGNDVRRTCKTCGMDYIASNVEDVALHKKFHSMNVGGVDVPKWFVDEGRPKKLRKEGADENGAPVTIVAIDRRDSSAARNVAMRVLHVANKELSAVQIDDAELWSRVAMDDDDKHGELSERKGSRPEISMGTDTEHDAAQLRREQHDSDGKGADRYKVYLYLYGQKCVGLCLVERISKAYRILSTEATKDNQTNDQISDVSSTPSETLSALPLASNPISYTSLDETPRSAIMGISRIWTSHSYRRKGIAKKLLDCAATSFLYGMTVEQNSIAFSQPTESGSKLARSWFGKLNGWHVYT